jgi:DNA polymerase-4
MLVRLIGVKLGGLVHGAQQLNLFDNNEKQVKLYLSMDKIRRRYGVEVIQRASGVLYKKK